MIQSLFLQLKIVFIKFFVPLEYIDSKFHNAKLRKGFEIKKFLIKS